MHVHYVEIVSTSVDAQCSFLKQVYGLSCDTMVEDLGNARVATMPNGVLVGVRSPLGDHEQPIVRTYFEVSDIMAAMRRAEAAGALIAYPPTKQGETGTWAICILDGIQYGLWQK
ncbi:hypothetical protein Spith_0556 [Spirochaeta thermophila DSM 6578]|uniref:VOC domain-containing protein n=1 Tax=Winmispira thermophila (strain ATCC 700085 / DSM 6578 / Z-1203) TaxID=869211 RepID=G0G9T6_WINT7|nr:hypothetical protein [Spirochaeta thermophila]AEJ60836.1 hypothetical protein Spith_0556 [Spirochaeta thermophila DSM 6578]